MSTTAAAPTSAPAGRLHVRGLELLEREAGVVGLFALYVVVVLAALSQTLVQDSWLTLVSGREIAQHGLPSTDTLTVWSHGKPWVDQQWLAQIAFYGLDRLGGIKLVLLTHAFLLGSAFAAALAVARRQASQKSVVLVGAVCMFLAPWALQMRAQSFAPLLFVVLMGLLAADSRAPSRRVLLVLPILALWANLHGTAVLGAVLVVLRALTRLRAAPGRRVESLALLASPALLVASPYGLSSIGYYHRMLTSPLLGKFLNEWRPSTPSSTTALFYVLAFAATALVARHVRALARFELFALVSLAASALLAVRSIVWFALACTILLPPLLDRELASRSSASRLLPRGRLAPLVAPLAIVVAVAVVATRPAAWFERAFPADAVPALRHELRDPGVRVIADDRHADWLLWQLPELRGRLAYDVRFELFSPGQFRELIAYRGRAGTDWQAAGRGYALVVLDPTEVPPAALRQYGRPLYRSDDLVVLRNRSA
jgi:hypothetical protein